MAAFTNHAEIMNKNTYDACVFKKKICKYGGGGGGAELTPPRIKNIDFFGLII